MLATTEYENRFAKSRIYENSWTDHHCIRIPWRNFLTAQSIPEETDVIDCPKRNHTDSDSSLSSTEDCYVVLEVQQPPSIIIEPKLNFAQINEDQHNIEHGQLAQSMIIETPLKENAIEHQSKPMIPHEEYAKVTQVLIHNDSSNIIKQKINGSKQSLNHRCSIISIDSIENDSYTSNTFQTHQETTTLIHTCTSERTCQERSDLKDQSVLPLYLDTKPSSFLRSIKSRTRLVKSEYYFPNDEIPTTEPLLLKMKYLDGRPTLTDLNALESFQKSQFSSKISSAQNTSYGKRLFNRVQNFFKSPSSYQQKTIFELFNEKKTKVNHY